MVLSVSLFALGVIGLSASIAAAQNPGVAAARVTGSIADPDTSGVAVANTPAIATIPALHTPSDAAKTKVPASPKSPAEISSPVAQATIVYGVSDPLLINLSTAGQIQRLDAMKAIGITSVRVDASWNWVQPDGPGSYDWSSLDAVVAAIHSVGLSADLIIDGCPAWAAVSSAAGNEFAQPASASEFGTYAGAVAARYGKDGTNYFEIWNEPNLATFWLPKPDPSAYTADLEAAYTAIKAADPSATVLSGGLAPGVDDGTNYDPRTFLEDMYADGAKESFDGLGYHPYSYPDSPDTDASWSGWSMMDETTPSIRSIMADNGDSAKKIWITEYGAPTSDSNSVGEANQSTDMAQAISLTAKLDWVASLYMYTWSDSSTLAADADGFGLLTSDNTPKPAYEAVVAALASNP